MTALARAAARGDSAALTAMVRATQGDVWRLCAHLVDSAAADDLAQETYLRAIPAFRRFRGDASVRTWLLTIARRVCAREIKVRQRARQASAGLAAAAARTAPDAGARAEVMLLLAALEPDRRAAFVLTQVLGCSYAEAAAICGCPVGTIRSRVARARADLDAMIAPPGRAVAGSTADGIACGSSTGAAGHPTAPG
jgi:RNA polymerase sigma-70 factor, ECF subfamily